MKPKKKTTLMTVSPKRSYNSPKLTRLGQVKQLTLKTGSATDGFGTFI